MSTFDSGLRDSGAGKGDRQRKQTPEEREKFAKEWDRIFKKRGKKKPPSPGKEKGATTEDK